MSLRCFGSVDGGIWKRVDSPFEELPPPDHNGPPLGVAATLPPVAPEDAGEGGSRRDWRSALKAAAPNAAPTANDIRLISGLNAPRGQTTVWAFPVNLTPKPVGPQFPVTPLDELLLCTEYPGTCLASGFDATYNRNMPRTVMFTAAAALSAIVVLGQNDSVAATQETPIFKSDVALVKVDAEVTDGTKLLGGFQKDDFRILDNGTDQPILHFSQSEEPLDLILLFDLSGSMISKLKRWSSAAPSGGAGRRR